MQREHRQGRKDFTSLSRTEDPSHSGHYIKNIEPEALRKKKNRNDDQEKKNHKVVGGRMGKV